MFGLELADTLYQQPSGQDGLDLRPSELQFSMRFGNWAIMKLLRKASTSETKNLAINVGGILLDLDDSNQQCTGSSSQDNLQLAADSESGHRS